MRAIVAKMDELRVADALDLLFDIFRRSNKYIDETEPWLLAKEEGKSARLETVLYNLTEAIVIGASVLESFMPKTAEEILRQLNTEARPLEQMDRFGLYPSGTRVTGDPKALFERKDLKQLLSEVEKLSKESGAFGEEKGKSSAGEGETPESASEGESPILMEKKAEIGYEDFEKLQFRVGKILSAEEVKKSKKLLRFEVLVGEEKLQILSGIKSFYRPEELVGKKVMVLCNLKPRMIAGYESQGMILSAEGHGGELALMTPMRDMPSGAGIC